MVLKNVLVANFVRGHALQMQFTLKAPRTPMTSGTHQVSDTARSIKLIISGASSADYALKPVLLVLSQ
jgi:hypothetical protein